MSISRLFTEILFHYLLSNKNHFVFCRHAESFANLFYYHLIKPCLTVVTVKSRITEQKWFLGHTLPTVTGTPGTEVSSETQPVGNPSGGFHLSESTLHLELQQV